MVLSKKMELVNLFFFVFATLFVVGIAQNDPCKTPNEQNGECVMIRNCPPLYTLLRTRPTLANNTNFLRRSHCGFDGHLPKVCCPAETIKMRNKADMPEDDILPALKSNLLPNTDVCGVDLAIRILGGEATDVDEFPWMALLIYELPNGISDYGCGGVLINERYVLTAAHCVNGKSLPKVWRLTSVRLGEYNKDSDDDCKSNGFTKVCLKIPPFNVSITERITHENYDPDDDDQNHDIALLRLAHPVKFSDYVKPICLPIREQERRRTYSGLNLTIAGWGQTENRSSSSVKLKLSVPVIPNTDCKAQYSDAGKIVTDKQMCAGGQDKRDSCRGDSGGPLMCISIDENGDANWYLAGVVSYGPVPCGIEDWPGVYTRVSKYMGWILRHMKP